MLLAVAAFGAGRLREFVPRVWAGYAQLQARIAAIDVTRAAFTEALRRNAPFPRPNPVVPHRIDAYPVVALRRHEEGDVLLKVLVLPSGEVGDVRLLHSSGSSQLDAAALTGVGGWYYVPAARNHHAVPAWVTVNVRFRTPAASPGTGSGG